MMLRTPARLFGFVIAVMAPTFACNCAEKKKIIEEDPVTPTRSCPAELDTAPPAELPQTSFVGLRASTATACPAPSIVASPASAGWVVRPLRPDNFRGGNAPLRGSGTAVELEDICVYRWSSPPGAVRPPNTEGLPPIDASGERPEALRTIGPDYPVVAALAGQSAGLAWSELNAAFRRQVGRMATLPGSQAALTKTWLAVVDAAPDGVGVPTQEDRSGHGLAVARILEDLTCPGGAGEANCAAEIRTYLALGYVRPGEPADAARGGVYGHQSDVAAAILRAVADWQARGGSPQRLVINLSLGWEPEAPLSALMAPQRLGGGTMSVYHAIQEAVCAGALVISAAGNSAAGRPRSKGPMLPAAWERLPAACASTPPPGYHPMVYAAGAIDGKGEALFNARPEGMPGIVAPAAHATASFGSASTSVLTGSSVSAAVTSAAAALAWAYREDLKPWQIMQRVYLSDPGTGGAPADFCLGASCSGRLQRRVNLSQSVAKACADAISGAPPCAPSTPALTAALTDTALTATMGNRLLALSATAPTTTSWHPDTNIPTPCQSTTQHWNAAGPRCDCPQDQARTPLAHPWVSPQPLGNPCDVCTLFHSAKTFKFEVSSTLDPDTKLQAVNLLILTTAPSVEEYLLPDPPTPLVPGAIAKWTVSGLPPTSTIVKSYVAARDASTGDTLWGPVLLQ